MALFVSGGESEVQQEDAQGEVEHLAYQDAVVCGYVETLPPSWQGAVSICNQEEENEKEYGVSVGKPKMLQVGEDASCGSACRGDEQIDIRYGGDGAEISKYVKEVEESVVERIECGVGYDGAICYMRNPQQDVQDPTLPRYAGFPAYFAENNPAGDKLRQE